MAFVYLIEATESHRLKIGIAIDPHKRLSSLQIGSPEPLQLVHAIRVGTTADARRVEKKLHARFELFHSHGEWFQGHGSIRRWFDEAKSRGRAYW